MKRDFDSDAIFALFRAISDDLVLLGALQAVELGAQTLAELKSLGFPDGLGLRLNSSRSKSVIRYLREVVEQWPEKNETALTDDLAADFAAIFLNAQIGASPYESYWLDEDHLLMQKPMFQVGDRYREHGMCVENRNSRADDHIVNELNFMVELIRAGSEQEKLVTAARFLDEHLLRWVGQFADRVANYSGSAFYSGLTLLTAAYCEELRDLLVVLSGEPRPDPKEVEARMKAREVEGIQVALPQPGVGPGC